MSKKVRAEASEKRLHGFVDIEKLLQEGTVGNCTLKRFTVSQEEATLFNLRCMLERMPEDVISPGAYIQLLVDDRVMMSDTPMERITSMYVLHHTEGSILIAGLGLGMIPETLLAFDTIERVTIVENNQNVIDLVWPQLACSQDPRFNVVLADARTYRPDCKYDYIFLDIWPDIHSYLLEEMRQMKKHYRRYLNKGGTTEVWRMDTVSRMARQERRFYGTS